MEYLNREFLQAISPENFRNSRPYPWIQIDKTLTTEGYELLRKTLPPIEHFERQIGVPGPHGLAPRDRYVLHFHPGVEVEEPWREFIRELQGPAYEAFLRHMFGNHTFLPTFEWYYAWDGCGLPPRVDAHRRLASQIFYFNAEEDWDPDWGGQILILESARRFSTREGPRYEQFGVAASVEPRGNASLLMQNTRHSWHGVRPLVSPPDKVQRLFVVSVNVPCLQVWWRGFRGLDPDGYSVGAA